GGRHRLPTDLERGLGSVCLAPPCTAPAVAPVAAPTAAPMPAPRPLTAPATAPTAAPPAPPTAVSFATSLPAVLGTYPFARSRHVAMSRSASSLPTRWRCAFG